MKIGILTFHRAYNYGAVLQAYALKKVIESFGAEVEIINYKCDQVDLDHHPRYSSSEATEECILSACSRES